MIMFNIEILDKAKELIETLKEQNKRITTAESCTGGLLSASITEIAGSSEVFDRGFITYSNKAKIDLLTVPTFYIDEYGAVSLETALAMAEGAILMSNSHISISVTGVAGPGGGTDNKPVGTVFIAVASNNGKTFGVKFNFDGDRNQIRQKATLCALNLALDYLQDQVQN